MKSKTDIRETAVSITSAIIIAVLLVTVALPGTASDFGMVESNGSAAYAAQLKSQSVSESRAAKANLTAAEQKLSTDLLHLLECESRTAGQSTELLKPECAHGQQLRSDSAGGMNEQVVYVYVYLGPRSGTQIIDPYVVQVTDRDEANHVAVAWVAVPELGTLAALPGVHAIRPVLQPRILVGSVTTEGDAIHRTRDVRAHYAYNGSGVRVGVISDGVNHLADAQSTGDLPATVTVLNNRIGGDEGTALLELVHDLAPGAALYFHDCGANKVAFTAAIDALVAAGCDIICEDVEWIDEPFFEDGSVALHLASVLASNELIYVTAAGDAGEQHYQGEYYNDGGNFHDFSRGKGSNLYVNLPSNGGVTVVLQWNDEFGQSGNDYDLYLYNTYDWSTVAKSYVTQNGNDDPREMVSYTNTKGSDIKVEININNFNGAAATKILEVFIYPRNGASVQSFNIDPADSIFGHHAIPAAITVGAIKAGDPGTDEIEPASSQGPVTISYPASVLRSKPDLCGVDGVNVTGAGGFRVPFFGTSAAAAHVAGIAALIWSAYPASSSAEIQGHLYAAAVDLGTPGYDPVFGWGRADALRVFEAPPQIVTGPATVINTTSATLTGTLMDTGGENCTVWFQYGLSDAYGLNTTPIMKSLAGAFQTNVTDLEENVTYHYRAVANNSKGTVYGADLTFRTVEEQPLVSFDTGRGAYPSISGTFNGTITPNKTLIINTLYTYPCSGTGGHATYAALFANGTLIMDASWAGDHTDDWQNLTFPATVTLQANETYTYTIITGSYPQVHHQAALPTANGWINCTDFTDVNGALHHNWIPAISMY